jgi:hypothetical protein
MKNTPRIAIIAMIAFLWSLTVNYCLNTLGYGYSFLGWQKWVLTFIPILLVGGIDGLERILFTKELQMILQKKLSEVPSPTNIIQALSRLSQEKGEKFSKKDVEKIVSKFKKQ